LLIDLCLQIDGSATFRAYLSRMTEQQLIAFFDNKKLPETLRIDRATTQLQVAMAVQRNIDMMLSDSKNGRAKHRLTQIVAALEAPYDGPALPRL
jgi:hypothetical protein